MICPRIEALILSEFHHKKGFTIIDVIQHQTHITETQFSIYSQLILYREEMCGHFLVSEFMDKYYVIGIPSLSHNTQDRNVYERAKYLYAVSVLVQKDYYNNQCGREVYKEIVSKLAHFFKFLEEASNVIYYNSVLQNKQYLHNLLQKSYRHINNNQQLVLSHFSNCFTIINLNRCQLPFALNQKKSKVVIKKSHVPITYLLDTDIQDIQSQFGKKLLSYAQIGDFNVRKIGDLLQDYDKVVAFYAKAVEMGIVYLADMFALQNRYALTPQIHRYVGDRRKKEQEQMLKICEEVSLKKAEHPKLTPNALLFLYLQLSRMSTLKKIINSNLLLFSNINVIKWIRISQMLGLIYRVHEKLAIENSSFYQQNFSNSVISNQSANESFGYNQNSRESQFISDERVRLYLQPKSVRSGSWVLNVKEEWERMNGLFNMHLKNMDNLDEICVNMRVSRCILFGLINFNSQRALKVYYVDQ